MKKILANTRKVRFQDCDPFNHLNNAKYLDYFINAREDQLLDDYGLDVFGLIATEKLGWVISSHQIAYFRPAAAMESITIESQLISYDSRALVVEMRMYDEKQTRLKALCWTRFNHFDLARQKPAEHSAELSLLFSQALLPVEQQDFEARRGHLLQQKNEAK
ncbi:acyl-CoA thioesterase [Pedobacter caeni]|uniref:Acyl-CoA thioester hydrolase n=1 Tax=Pedobacter caeni TaxID=288992 RepID=A0A1M4WFK1_9SPHI|nr:acyl-CoA thioesterase [Pedobacter caeni]SHE80006.1 acyl-CoA thioester hydrolase [Pedobacter caeni]